MEQKAQQIIEILKNKDFNAVYAKDLDEAKQTVLSMIPAGSSIAVGGSVTLNEMNLIDDFRKGDYKFIDRYNVKTFDEMLDKYREGFTSDVFVTSVNAVTKNGELVCTDCTGNRTGAIAFGPKKVIVVIGVNKIVENIDEGIKRAKDVAPSNAKRINHKTPCVEDNICHNCHTSQCICNITSIIHNCYKFPGRISVVVVPQVLGY